MRILAVLLTIFFLTSCEIAVPVGGDAVAATDTAKIFVSLLDKKQLNESWSLVDPTMKASITQSTFTAEISAFRNGYGKFRDRTFKDVVLGQIPGQPPGEYATVIFETTFSGDLVQEKVNLRKSAGEWMIVRYTGDPIDRPADT